MPYLSLDIETYGILEGKKQTYFHPKLMEEYDGVKAGRQVITTGLSWRDGDDVKSAIFVMNKPAHRDKLWKWISKARRDGWTILGQNITFDMMCLRYNYREARVLLEHPLPLMDLIITNYLHDESCPEKSLKDLAPLLSITKYREGFHQYKGPNDPNLWKYNCQDTSATLLSQETLERTIRSFYGANTQKLSTFCFQWYSELLWGIIWATEYGITMNTNHLRELDERYHTRFAKIDSIAKDMGIILSGKGSDTSKRKVMESALEFLKTYSPNNVPTLKLTDETKQIAFKEENRNVLANALPHSCQDSKQVRVLGRAQSCRGMIDKYLTPLLRGQTKKKTLIKKTCVLGSQIYPTWFPVPSEFESDNGGTKQARIVAKSPPVQTFPPLIKSCITTRHRNGYLVWFDYSQIELRVAALLSNDTPMLTEYRGKPDLHTQTAKLIFGDDIVKTPHFKESPYRQAGKTLNFLMLFKGGANKFQETLMRDVGLEMSFDQCQTVIDKFWLAHPELATWQNSLVDFVKKHGYYELPLIGQSRLFLGSEKSVDADQNDIVNLPVQATAANIMLSAQFHLNREFRQARMKSFAPINIYDAAAIEVSRFELDKVKCIMDRVLPNPTFFRALCDHLGRSVPLMYDVKIKEVLC